MRKIHTLVRWLGICDGNMQEGSFRCDANVSVRPAGSETLGTRTEIKNVQLVPIRRAGYRLRDRAPDRPHRIRGARSCSRPACTTPSTTRQGRCGDKEEADGLSLFPRPPTCCRSASARRSSRRCGVACPELPDARRERLIDEYRLGAAEAAQLVSYREVADYFEAAVAAAGTAEPGRGGTARAAKLDQRRAGQWALNRDGLAIADAPDYGRAARGTGAPDRRRHDLGPNGQDRIRRGVGYRGRSPT